VGGWLFLVLPGSTHLFWFLIWPQGTLIYDTASTQANDLTNNTSPQQLLVLQTNGRSCCCPPPAKIGVPVWEIVRQHTFALFEWIESSYSGKNVLQFLPFVLSSNQSSAPVNSAWIANCVLQLLWFQLPPSAGCFCQRNFSESELAPRPRKANYGLLFFPLFFHPCIWGLGFMVWLLFGFQVLFSWRIFAIRKFKKRIRKSFKDLASLYILNTYWKLI
jgi:hypothetical protein